MLEKMVGKGTSCSRRGLAMGDGVYSMVYDYLFVGVLVHRRCIGLAETGDCLDIWRLYPPLRTMNITRHESDVGEM